MISVLNIGIWIVIWQKTNLPRLVAIMVGDAPLVNEEYVPVYNAYNGQTETMEAKWANLKKMEEETFAKIIMGKSRYQRIRYFR